jgi:hypothetical protein
MVRLNADFADPAIVNTHIEPSIRLDMERTANKITNQIRMANDDLVPIDPPGYLKISLECLVSLSPPLLNISLRYVFEVFMLCEGTWDSRDAFPQKL